MKNDIVRKGTYMTTKLLLKKKKWTDSHSKISETSSTMINLTTKKAAVREETFCVLKQTNVSVP